MSTRHNLSARISLALYTVFLLFSDCPALAGSLNDENIRSGDKIQVTVYNHPELSQSVVVNASGNIALPLAGIIHASGSNARQLAKKIDFKLAHFIYKVAVDAQVVESITSIFVSGASVSVLPYTPGETLSQTLAQIQSPPQQDAQTTGSAPSAAASRSLYHGRIDPHRIWVTRDQRRLGPYDALAMQAGGDPGITMEPGDLLGLVNKPVHVNVAGDVIEPGSAFLGRGEPLSNAITQVGGIDGNSAAYMILTRAGISTVHPLGDIVLSQPAQDGDTITLPRAPHITVAGSVEKPGELALHGDGSLLSAIYNAGGPTKAANLQHVAVIRNGERKTYNVDAAVHGTSDANPLLADGDTVFIPTGRRVDYSGFFQAFAAAGTLIYAFK